MRIDWEELITIFISFIAGVLLTLLGNYLTTKREKSRLKREIIVTSCLEFISGPKPLPMAAILIINAINTGVRPITISRVGIILKDVDGNSRSRFGVSSEHIPFPKLPKTISDGEVIQFAMDLTTAIEMYKRINSSRPKDIPDLRFSTVVVTDIEGNDYIKELSSEDLYLIQEMISGKEPTRFTEKE